MSRQYCDFCHQPMESIDFHLSIKGGCVCPACVPLVRSVGWEWCQENDVTDVAGYGPGLPSLPGTDEAVRAPLRVFSRHASRAMPRPVLRPMFS